ncbi:MAG: hypothetical protein ACFFCI_05685 [Promethearchaeota archaeon]
MSLETEFFNDIFKSFLCIERRFDESDLWKSTSIIKLMKVSDRVENQHFIADGLKIILNLHKFNECGYLIDSYESESHPVSDLVEPEKEELISILKSELI